MDPINKILYDSHQHSYIIEKNKIIKDIDKIIFHLQHLILFAQKINLPTTLIQSHLDYAHKLKN